MFKSGNFSQMEIRYAYESYLNEWQHGKDEHVVLPNVARIPNVMLQKLDPANPNLMAYLQTINPSIETGVLLPKGIAGTSKRGKNSKNEVVKPVHEENSKSTKVVIPSESGVLKLSKKIVHRPRHSPERHPFLENVTEQFVSSPREIFASKIKNICKHQINRKGVLIMDITAHFPPSSKKMDSLVKLHVEATRSLGGDVETFHVDTTTNLNSHSQASIPKQTSIEDIHHEMTHEVAKVDRNYSILHTKVDIVAEVMMKLVEYHTSLLNIVDVMSESDSKTFVHLQGLLEDLKELIFKLAIPPCSSVSLDSISQMHSSLESYLKADLDRFLTFIKLMPKAAPPVSTGVQGGENGVSTSRDSDQGKVVGKVTTTQLPTSFLMSTMTSSTSITFKSLTKCIDIGSFICGTSSKPPPSSKETNGKWKGSNIEPIDEDKKIALECK
ncbi:unnamed protein product [Lactuca saligna]|uniref:Uncharacterized protein n=1 Tax=Lactuca saligna TaxID=75948 RepID=A0AA36EEI7_LACSI|nr:unnamed protein product [Lactuca saligna]